MDDIKNIFSESKPFSNLIIPFISGLILFLSIFLLSATAGQFVQMWKAKTEVANMYPANVINVEGTGEAKGIPNIAEFSFSVTETKATVAEAQSIVEGKIKAITDYLKENGVEESKIKTDGYNIYPKYEYLTTGQSKQIGFEVSQNISVKVKESEKAGTLLAGVGEKGATNLSGLNFTIEDDEALKGEARSKAIENAKMKAKKIADDLGLNLVRITSFYENVDPYYGNPMPYGGMMEKSSMSLDSVTLPKGENTYTSRVSITFEIK